jgi:hypothetical protein
VSFERLSTDDFIAKLKEAVENDTIRWITTDFTNQEIVVIYPCACEEADCVNSYEYRGPNPADAGYVEYMKFLGDIQRITGLNDFVRAYLFDRLR